MKLPERLFSRMVLAYLPFMIYSYEAFRAGVAALWIVAFLWFTATFFWFTNRFFPKQSLMPAFLLWLVVWAQAVWTLTKLPPYWIVSVFLLMPVSFLDDKAKPGHVRVFSKRVPRYFFERALSGIGFVGFVIALALVREIGENQLGIRAFDQPAAMLLVIAGVALLWKNQPYQKRSPRRISGQRQDVAIEAGIAEKEKRSG